MRIQSINSTNFSGRIKNNDIKKKVRDLSLDAECKSLRSFQDHLETSYNTLEIPKDLSETSFYTRPEDTLDVYPAMTLDSAASSSTLVAIPATLIVTSSGL